MEFHGAHLIAGTWSRGSSGTFTARAPRAGSLLDPAFAEGTSADVDAACRAAAAAFDDYRARPGADVAAFLDRIADNLAGAGEALIVRAAEETGLGRDRLTGELARTQNQIRMFAALVRKGDWVDARIDRARPDRQPLPKPDLRRMLIPVGPVAVWAASNFPLAFSVAGGDTASALAAGNPVIVKAHPGHPGTSELAAAAIADAARALGLPAGVFSLIHGTSPEVSRLLVRHPAVKSAAFTGSLQAGRALYDAAAARPDPIPFFAEMGSVNPVFVLPRAAATRLDAIVDGLFQSINLGVGQFCTNPGVIAGIRGEAVSALASQLRARFAAAPAGTMLYGGIRDRYRAAVARLAERTGVTSTRSAAAARDDATEAAPAFFEATVDAFLAQAELRDEVFGPSSLLVVGESAADLERVAEGIDGSLTATVHGTDEDLVLHRSLLLRLETRAGRLIVNGYPTGVEVCPSMQHGGPYPATTDARFTSVGTAAIQRFARPVCYQGFPASLLPPALQEGNPLGIRRMVDGEAEGAITA